MIRCLGMLMRYFARSMSFSVVRRRNEEGKNLESRAKRARCKMTLTFILSLAGRGEEIRAGVRKGLLSLERLGSHREKFLDRAERLDLRQRRRMPYARHLDGFRLLMNPAHPARRRARQDIAVRATHY